MDAGRGGGGRGGLVKGWCWAWRVGLESRGGAGLGGRGGELRGRRRGIVEAVCKREK